MPENAMPENAMPENAIERQSHAGKTEAPANSYAAGASFASRKLSGGTGRLARR
jgi:hypothetical protein